MPTRVAFNATPLLSTVTGIGNYIVELGAALCATGEVDAYAFYGYRWRHEAPISRISNADREGRGTMDRVKPLLPFRGTLRHAAKYLGFRRGLAKFKVDLYHEPNYIPLAFDVPVAITIHDLSWIRYPQAQPPDRVRWLEQQLPKAVAIASMIFVDSDFVRDEVVSTFGVDRARVITAHLGVREHFRPRTAREMSETLEAYGLAHGQYVLSVGTIEPRKNLAHILEAFDLLPTELKRRFPLVVAGAGGWQSSDLVAHLQQANQPCVRFLGQVSRKDLLDLYAGAALFAFPSLYEGFGLPPLEAMASGVPVIVSNRASMPEVVGDAGEMMDPCDPEDTADRLAALLDDPDRRARMAQRGLARAARFTWAACADKTFAGYQQAIHGREAASAP